MVAPWMIKDSDWVRQSFLVQSQDIAPIGQSYRFYTEASAQFTDTTLGGSFVINPPPQFTPTADLRAPSRLVKSAGMGRFYYESIDRNSQRVYFRMGTPQFNSLTNFFTGFYDSGAGALARTGRSPGLFFNIGRAVGFVVAVMNWQLLAVHLLGVGARFFLGKQASRFYYLKGGMPAFYSAAQTVLNQLLVNQGVIPRLSPGSILSDGDDISATPKAGPYEWGDEGRQLFHAASPDIFNSDGSVDLYAVMTRAARLSHKQYQLLESQLSESGASLIDGVSNVFNSSYSDSNRPSYIKYLESYYGATSDGSGGNTSSGVSAAQPLAQVTSGDGTEAKTSDGVDTLLTSATGGDGFLDFLESEMRDGGAFIGFRVNNTGSVTDSFSNQTERSQIQDKMNSTSAQARSMRFDAADFNVAGDNPLGAIVQKAGGAVGDLISGALDFVGFSGLASLAGSCFVDVPEHWSAATANLPTGQYTINLVSPYGNPISQMMNLYVPLSFLLAMALPLATGKQSYTAPFLCEFYDQGRCQSRLGLIDSMTITRGTTNLPFTRDGKALGIDVSFSVRDLSTIMYMPISQGINMAALGIGALTGAVAGGAPGAAAGFGAAMLGQAASDDDNFFSDYMAILGGLSVADQFYAWRRYKLNLTRQMTNFKTWTSPAHMASWAGNTPPGRLMSMFWKAVDRQEMQ